MRDDTNIRTPAPEVPLNDVRDPRTLAFQAQTVVDRYTVEREIRLRRHFGADARAANLTRPLLP